MSKNGLLNKSLYMVRNISLTSPAPHMKTGKMSPYFFCKEIKLCLKTIAKGITASELRFTN